MPDFAETSKKICRIALLDAPEYQPWAGYYLTRIIESEIIYELFGLKEDFTLLEIGCGNGFYSALFSPHVKKIYSGDLEFPCASTHTMGITKARSLLDKLDISNVTLSSFSGAKLPFKDETFNLVFTSSTLEHIPNREKAVKEIKRVLKPGGRAVIIVPNFITSVYSIFHIPLYLCVTFFRKTFKRNTCRNPHAGPVRDAKDISVFAKAGKALMPKPHGEYKNLLDELQSSYPAKWEKLLTDEGLRVLASRGTTILPWSLISVFSSRLGALLYGLTKGFHKKIVCKYDFFKYFSYLICFVAEKRI